MNKKFELLAPGGDIDSIKAAIVAGADAIYCGLDSFNARNRAVNLTFEQLIGVLELAHKNNCQVFLTLNILILENEIPALIKLLNKLVNSKIDGVIVQDIGLFYLLSNHFKTLDIHASTQMTTHNEGQILFLKKMGASRVNLSRELNIDEIKSLTALGHRHNVLSEVFVHGSYCIGFSGLCYISSVYGGNSGNRGRCSQPCRDQYQQTQAGNDYPLNMKDNSAFSDLKLLVDAGVDSLKIEGRIKGPSYVYTVVKSWRKQLEKEALAAPLADSDGDLYKVFNRDFSDGYLKGDISHSMFIDNPRDHTLKYVELKHQGATAEKIGVAKRQLYDEKVLMQQGVEDKIKNLSIAKKNLLIAVSGVENSPLKIQVTTPDKDFEVLSQSNLGKAEQAMIDRSTLEKRFKSLNSALYQIEALNFVNLQDSLCIPFRELTSIKNRIAFLLNDSVELMAPVSLPVLNKPQTVVDRAQLSVMISSEKDIALSASTSADIYFKLPDSFKKGCTKLASLFLENEQLIPWFPAVLIGKNFDAAVEFLNEVKPRLVVTNNTGIAYHAYQMGIKWIAGPYLNTTNSYAMINMQEQFNCSGAFISNELNKNQISSITRPDNFRLYYNIYQPVMLMTSRQCFFQQTVGCKKTQIDDKCMQRCSKSTSIINLKGNAFVINKQRGGYPSIYSDKPLLNTEIVGDLRTFFNGFFIDLTDVGLVDDSVENKVMTIKLFEDFIAGRAGAEEELKKVIGPFTNGQYKKGL